MFTQGRVRHVACNDARRTAHKIQAVHSLLWHHLRQVSIAAAKVGHHCRFALAMEKACSCLYWL